MLGDFGVEQIQREELVRFTDLGRHHLRMLVIRGSLLALSLHLVQVAYKMFIWQFDERDTSSLA